MIITLGRTRSSPRAAASVKLLCSGLQDFQDDTSMIQVLHSLWGHTNYYPVFSNYGSGEDVLRATLSHGSSLSIPYHCRASETVHHEGMLGPSSLSSVWALALLRELPLMSSTFHDIQIWPWWTDVVAFHSTCGSGLDTSRNIIIAFRHFGLFTEICFVYKCIIIGALLMPAGGYSLCIMRRRSARESDFIASRNFIWEHSYERFLDIKLLSQCFDWSIV